MKPKLLLLLPVVLILGLAVAVTASPSKPAASKTAAPNPNITALTGSKPLQFNIWWKKDQQLLQTHYAAALKSPAAAQKQLTGVISEWNTITNEITRILGSEVYLSPQGVKIYPPVTSGKLHVLGIAKTAREKFIDLVVAKKLTKKTPFSSIYSSLETGNSSAVDATVKQVKFRPVPPADYPVLKQAVAALDGINIPKEIFRNYSLFLLPYAITGLGGYSQSQDLPVVEESAFISARHQLNEAGFPISAVTHEFGHYIHQQFIGEYLTADGQESELWKEYLQLRGNHTWSEGSWKDTTVENFAEDFRVLLGSPAAQKEAYAGGYGDPRSDNNISQALDAFIRRIITQTPKILLAYNNITLTTSGPVGKGMLTPANGLENLDTLITTSPQIKITGTLKPGAGFEPVLEAFDTATEGKKYDHDINLTKKLVNTKFTTDFKLPAPGKYQLVLGFLKQGTDTLIAYKIININYLSVAPAKPLPAKGQRG